jgi:hypothetical protein
MMVAKHITWLDLVGSPSTPSSGRQGARWFAAIAPRPVTFHAHYKYSLRAPHLASPYIAAPRAEFSSQSCHRSMMPARSETGGLVGRAIAGTIDKLEEFAR